MKLDLFSVPIYIGNIDVDKIKIEQKRLREEALEKSS